MSVSEKFNTAITVNRFSYAIIPTSKSVKLIVAMVEEWLETVPKKRGI